MKEGQPKPVEVKETVTVCKPGKLPVVMPTDDSEAEAWIIAVQRPSGKELGS